jgi:hypothetical protein
VFRRILAIALLGVLGTALAGLAPAAAEPCRHPCEVVANDGVIAGLAGEPAEPAAVRRGLLTRSTAETPAPEMAIVAGLAVLGTTLGVITRRRRVVRVAATAAVVRYPVDAELRSEPSLYLR